MAQLRPRHNTIGGQAIARLNTLESLSQGPLVPLSTSSSTVPSAVLAEAGGG